MAQRKPISRQGYEKLEKKLKHMKTVAMPRLERALGEARDHGDISDSGEFSAAKEEIWLLEKQIADLEGRLVYAEVVESHQETTDEVTFGAKVTLENIDSKEVGVFRLVGEGETTLHNEAVSVASPLGQALIGRKIGDQFEVKVPAGLLRYEVREISYEA